MEEIKSFRIDEIAREAVDRNATDIHITAGVPPIIRVDGRLIPLIGYPPMTPKDTQEFIYSFMNEKQKKTFEEKKELDFSFGIKGIGRFRVNVFYQRGTVAAALRRIPYEIKPMEELGLIPKVRDLCHLSMGLVLVTGPTGSGKTTTLASMIDYINANFPHHIITIEDPIEYIYQHKKSVIAQRELGTDTDSFALALKYALREDPDVILVGEMRDLETIRAALTAAETGHLVFGTLHTNTAVQTINRIINVFPMEEQDQVRTELSFVLQGVISQRLLPKIGGGRVLIHEVMIPNIAIRNLIRENKVHQIYGLMQTGQAESGMQTMNQSIIKALQRKLITVEDAFRISPDPEELKRMISTFGVK
ncbi:MAG TPA: type IV pilus twitching motility protein PilT [Sulfurihydrogenibium sp.]|jgi:twitching motility protein PilT|uniref:PilT/PilU family type 4a pilus ATPase n=1 Tax=Sulfurihydrogenibium sp. (strain YO3AOP1) TaxID=436114 RepID=UPI00017254F0|nr:type IV pilus twitching motility protein PilT [Sulfurihydrogenibium sp. YO3AOP1]ACD67341.1 twitching motility protein [Sulfurihydrogenibium sp. YO3AOP1]HBT97879.1 type IV pilus twitching motility protein PilT [Sulfurihydrogenibium sp.]